MRASNQEPCLTQIVTVSRRDSNFLSPKQPGKAAPTKNSSVICLASFTKSSLSYKKICFANGTLNVFSKASLACPEANSTRYNFPITLNSTPIVMRLSSGPKSAYRSVHLPIGHQVDLLLPSLHQALICVGWLSLMVSRGRMFQCASSKLETVSPSIFTSGKLSWTLTYPTSLIIQQKAKARQRVQRQRLTTGRRKKLSMTTKTSGMKILIQSQASKNRSHFNCN